MKYRINEDSVIPCVELEKGKEGVINRANLYGNHTVLYTTDGRAIFVGYPVEWTFFPLYLTDASLSDFDDDTLKEFAKLHKLPLEELEEIRELEREYRMKKEGEND